MSRISAITRLFPTHFLGSIDYGCKRRALSDLSCSFLFPEALIRSKSGRSGSVFAGVEGSVLAHLNRRLTWGKSTTVFPPFYQDPVWLPC